MNSILSPPALQIVTGARLHCGLFSDPRPQGRRFQGFGMMIQQPGFEIQAQHAESEQHEVICNIPSSHSASSNTADQAESLFLTPQEKNDLCQRILKLLAQLDASCQNPLADSSVNSSADSHKAGPAPSVPLRLEVRSVIPAHRGLGSGTQLALAVGSLWQAFHASADQSTAAGQAGSLSEVTELSKRLNRGRRSCIGTYGFGQGGLLMDRGMAEQETLGTCRLSQPLPEEWRFVLATPRVEEGLSGEQESQAFQKLPPISTDSLNRLEELLNQIESQPADFHSLSQAMTEFGLIVGESFAPVQGGRFSHLACEQVFAMMQQTGVEGIAQSSWGPTMFGLCEHQAQADELAQFLQADPQIEVRIARPMNSGAQLNSVK